MNVEFPSQLLNLFITGRCTLFGEYHIRLPYRLCSLRSEERRVVAKFSSNPDKEHFEGLVHILRYIRYNKTLGLKCYVNINDALVSDLLRQASIKTENHLMAFFLF